MTATDEASRQMCRGPAPVVPKADTRRADGPNLAAGALAKETWQLNSRKACPHSMGQTSVEIPDHALTPRFCRPPFLS
ncbi:hypothetical protein [Prevotella denticola]|uniref:hypothetical protein n=1 Tax=Prevotella denticola TaxID=28129 RepID=UPI002431A004|nr:hypothetical protein [Prevotella denticola]